MRQVDRRHRVGVGRVVAWVEVVLLCLGLMKQKELMLQVEVVRGQQVG